MGGFIYILDSSNSSALTFRSSQFASSSGSNWTGIWTGNSNGAWTDKQSSHFSTAKEIRVKNCILFHVKNTTDKFWNDGEMIVKSFCTSHLQMMNRLELLFYNGTARSKGMPKSVDETHQWLEHW